MEYVTGITASGGSWTPAFMVRSNINHCGCCGGKITMSKISHILLSNPVVVPTGTKLNEAVKLLRKNKVTSLLVTRNNKLAGVVSVVDIASSSDKKGITVEEVMHSPEITIDSDRWITDAILSKLR